MMWLVLDDEVVEVACSDCADCPYSAQCDEEELFWGCSVWGISMGEDL